MKLAFESVPAAGTVVMLDEQAFELIGSKPHLRKDGAETVLLIWRTACAECGDPFECPSPLVTSGLTRRCIEHSQPGKPVGRTGKRGKGNAVQVRIIEPKGETA